VVPTVLGETHLTSAGTGPDLCVYLPGTNFNAATSVALLEALAAHCRVVCVDLPGQPGLSTATRPREDARGHERWLRQVVPEARRNSPGRVALVGHSRGAAVALSVDPGAVDALVLLSPAGLVKAHLSRSTLVPSLAWLLRPTDRRSARLVDLMAGPTSSTDHSALAGWMTLAARSTRTSGAPGPLPPDVLARWRGHDVRVLVGEHDVFFPPDRLAGPVRSLLGAQLEVVHGAGHLLPDQRPDAVLAALGGALS
jgi:pimeloyl-ACP methyl ester carboxylesterase